MNLKIFKVLIILIIFSSQVLADDNNKEISFYTGTFDVIDKEGDDQTTLFGVEHKNPDLFRDTFLGKFSPVTGMFMTGKGATYIYTGVEAQYGIGPIKILPSFTPGFYEKGGGKDLGAGASGMCCACSAQNSRASTPGCPRRKILNYCTH